MPQRADAGDAARLSLEALQRTGQVRPHELCYRHNTMPGEPCQRCRPSIPGWHLPP